MLPILMNSEMYLFKQTEYHAYRHMFHDLRKM